jgi:hypothetical protein
MSAFLILRLFHFYFNILFVIESVVVPKSSIVVNFIDSTPSVRREAVSTSPAIIPEG